MQDSPGHHPAAVPAEFSGHKASDPLDRLRRAIDPVYFVGMACWYAAKNSS